MIFLELKIPSIFFVIEGNLSFTALRAYFWSQIGHKHYSNTVFEWIRLVTFLVTNWSRDH